AFGGNRPGDGNGEVVQRHQGVRFHCSRRRREGYLRARLRARAGGHHASERGPARLCLRSRWSEGTGGRLNPTGQLGIQRIEIVTDQLDRTVQFYTEVLGFTVKALDRIDSSGLGVPINLVYLDLGGTVVELIAYEGAAVDPAPHAEHLGYRMIALEVDDMQKT